MDSFPLRTQASCTTFVSQLQGKDIQIVSNNTATVANINFQGGPSFEFSQLTTSIWAFAVKHQITSAKHLAGSINLHADFLPRTLSHHNWRHFFILRMAPSIPGLKYASRLRITQCLTLSDAYNITWIVLLPNAPLIHDVLSSSPFVHLTGLLLPVYLLWMISCRSPSF